MNQLNRRRFLQLSSLTALPVLGGLQAYGTPTDKVQESKPFDNGEVWFINDGPMYKPTEYIQKLKEIDTAKPIMRDFYGNSGAISELEKKFVSITGKPAAIYMPSGTMANQLAISQLGENSTKVFVQETSHVYRDEADAAQKLFHKRLIPLAKGEAFFTKEELQKTVQYHEEGEVFKSGEGGVVSIENPVRRNNGAFVPFETLKEIADYAGGKGLKMHLDGARIYMAAAATGKSIAEYAALFDTIYISLYKYLGANGGAILCGPVELINKMHHLVKIHGGSVYTSWTNGAMALHHLEGLEDRLRKANVKSSQLFALMNASGKLTMSPMTKNNTNMYQLKFTQGIDVKKVVTELKEKQGLIFQNPDATGAIRVTVNDSLLHQDNDRIMQKVMSAIKNAS